MGTPRLLRARLLEHARFTYHLMFENPLSRIQFVRRTRDLAQRDIGVRRCFRVALDALANLLQPQVIAADRRIGPEELPDAAWIEDQWILARQPRAARRAHLSPYDPALQRMHFFEAVRAVVAKDRPRHALRLDARGFRAP